MTITNRCAGPTKKELRKSDHSSDAGLYCIKFAYYEYDSDAIKEANENDLRVWIELWCDWCDYPNYDSKLMNDRREIQEKLKKAISLYHEDGLDVYRIVEAFFDMRTVWVKRDQARLIWRFFVQRGWEENTISS